LSSTFPGIRACDLRNCGREGPDTVTRTFTLDGKVLRLDLCGKHWARLQKAIAPYAEAARVRPGRPRFTDPPAGPSRQASPVVQRIRLWAMNAGLDVKPRGPLPHRVTDAYFDEPGREEADMLWMDDRMKRIAKMRQERKEGPGRRRPPKPPCTVCGDPSVTRGWCWTHLQRWYRDGDPRAADPKITGTGERFRSRRTVGE